MAQSLSSSSELDKLSDTMAQSSSSSSELDHLITMFQGKNLSRKQIAAIYLLSGKNYEASLKCILDGPNLQTLVILMNTYFDTMPMIKVKVDADTVWNDLVAHYKSTDEFQCRLRISLSNNPAIDTGGIRRQMYTQAYNDFCTNKYINLFDGPPNQLRPASTAVARSSGLLKLLGKMVAHSIFQDGIGFPYLSATAYWYLIGGENMAIEYATTNDLPEDSKLLIEKVHTLNYK